MQIIFDFFEMDSKD